MSFIPNTTPTPNWLYNGEMKKMSETELKVVLLVTRKTLGWFDPMTEGRKTQDYISQSQFIEFTGQSNRAIATAIQGCVDAGWIVARNKAGELCDTPEKRARRKIWYQLGNIFIDKVSSELSSSDKKSGEHFSKSGEHNDINLVKNVHSTKETITKETKQKSKTSVLQGNQWNELIDSFKDVNPLYEEFYKNKTERAALEYLTEKLGFEKLKGTITHLREITVKPYAPKITKPTELKRDLGKLITFYKQEMSKEVERKHYREREIIGL